MEVLAKSQGSLVAEPGPEFQAPHSLSASEMLLGPLSPSLSYCGHIWCLALLHLQAVQSNLASRVCLPSLS